VRGLSTDKKKSGEWRLIDHGGEGGSNGKRYAFAIRNRHVRKKGVGKDIQEKFPDHFEGKRQGQAGMGQDVNHCGPDPGHAPNIRRVAAGNTDENK